MRLFAATIATETNTFSPLPTSIEAYRECVFLRPGEHPDATALMCTAPLWVARRRAAAEGFTLVEGSCFAASPAGTTNRADYETMRDEIVGQVKAALPLDGVLLGLHGAMVAHGYDDVEGDVIERVARRCRAQLRHRRRTRPALPPHAQARRAGGHHHPVQGIPAHRRGGSRRGPADPGAENHPQAGEAGDVGLRLPADRQLPDHPADDARIRRPDDGDGGQGQRALHFDLPLLPVCRRGGRHRPHPGDHRRRQGEGGQAGHRDRPGVRVVPRPQRAGISRRGRRHHRGAGFRRPPGGDGGPGRQWPAAARPPTTPPSCAG